MMDPSWTCCSCHRSDNEPERFFFFFNSTKPRRSPQITVAYTTQDKLLRISSEHSPKNLCSITVSDNNLVTEQSNDQQTNNKPPPSFLLFFLWFCALRHLRPLPTYTTLSDHMTSGQFVSHFMCFCNKRQTDRKLSCG